jgi:hypothetical protein
LTIHEFKKDCFQYNLKAHLWNLSLNLAFFWRLKIPIIGSSTGLYISSHSVAMKLFNNGLLVLEEKKLFLKRFWNSTSFLEIFICRFSTTNAQSYKTFKHLFRHLAQLNLRLNKSLKFYKIEPKSRSVSNFNYWGIHRIWAFFWLNSISKLNIA